jgi:hypothetical protein
MGFGNPKFETPGANRGTSGSVVSPKAILGTMVDFANQARAALPQTRGRSFLGGDEVNPADLVISHEQKFVCIVRCGRGLQYEEQSGHGVSASSSLRSGADCLAVSSNCSAKCVSVIHKEYARGMRICWSVSVDSGAEPWQGEMLTRSRAVGKNGTFEPNERLLAT